MIIGTNDDDNNDDEDIKIEDQEGKKSHLDDVRPMSDCHRYLCDW